MKNVSILALLVFMVGVMTVGSGVVLAGDTVYVGPGTGAGPCATPTFNSIQAAEDVAHAGQTIKVCPGTYNEAVELDVDDLAAVQVRRRWDANVATSHPITPGHSGVSLAPPTTVSTGFVALEFRRQDARCLR